MAMNSSYTLMLNEYELAGGWTTRIIVLCVF